MTSDPRSAFVQLLKQDAARLHQMAEDWDTLGKYGGQAEGLNGEPLVSASDMAARFRRQEEELRNLISKLI